MRLLIFGASGRMGHLLVRNALSAGHHVTAYVRNPEKLQVQHPQLSVVAGLLDDEAALDRVVDGIDAVIEGVGSFSEGTRRIISSMERHHVARLVVVSTCSVDDPGDGASFARAALVTIVKTAIPGPYAEVRRAAELVRASSLDWTLVRVAKLTNAPATGSVISGRYGFDNVGLTITRADMAAFLLAQVTDDTNIRKAPAISN